MDIALANEDFLRSHGIRVRGQQVEQLRAEIAAASQPLRDPHVARRRGRRRARSPGWPASAIGLSETATLLEFTAAAAGGLDHYSAFLTADQLRDIYSQIEGNFVGPGRRAEGRQRRAADRAT